MLVDFLLKFFLFYLPLLFSLCVHEFAHGWIAKKRGDLTAFEQGRLTLNPIAHIDFLGTLALPLIFLFTNSPIFFGWAKPVPVNPGAFQNPKQDMFWVALAGPLSNFILALLGAFCLTFFHIIKIFDILPMSQFLFSMMEMLIYINLLLGVFNLLPLHPLDGAKVLDRFLPLRWNLFLRKYQNYTYIILIFLAFSGGFYILAKPIIFVTHSLIALSQWCANFFII